MDLSVDVLQLVVEYLPKSAQYALIGDTPVGRHSCNQHYKFIGFSGFPSFFHPALHVLNTIGDSPERISSDKSPVYVSSYRLLTSKYPYFVPEAIFFSSLNQLVEFCAEYGEEIHKFSAVDIWSCTISEGISIDQVPTLHNVNLLDTSRDLPGRNITTDRQLVEKFGSIKALNSFSSAVDISWWPGIERLVTPTLDDFSTLGLKSLDVVEASDFHPGFLPSTLKHLELKTPKGKLDFSGLHLTSLKITFLSSTNYTQVLFNSSIPHTLRSLDIKIHDDHDSLEHAQIITPIRSTVFPNLLSLELTNVPVEVWNCMATPRIRSLCLRSLAGSLKSIVSSSLEKLSLLFLTLDQDFQFPASLAHLSLYRVKRVGSETSVEESITLPESLITFELYGRFSDYSFGKGLLKVKLYFDQDINQLQSFFDQLPSNISKVWVSCSSSSSELQKPLDLSRFKKLVKLSLIQTNLDNDTIVFPPNVVELDLEGNKFSSIPMLPELERLTLAFDTIFLQSLAFPPKLRWLSVYEEFTTDRELDLRSSGLEYIEILDDTTLKKLTLPKTTKALTLSSYVNFPIDSSLCGEFFTIYRI